MKNKILKILLVTMIMILCISSISAENFVNVDTEKTEQNIDEDLQDTFVGMNQTINLNSKVNAIAILFGQTVRLHGEADYFLSCSAGLNIDGKVHNEAFAWSETISITDKASFGENAYLSGNVVKVSGTFGKKLFVCGSNVKIENATIEGDVYIMGTDIVIGENVKINGTLTYYKDEDTSVEISKLAQVANKKEIDVKTLETKSSEETSISSLLSLLERIIESLIIFLIIYAINSRIFKSNKQEAKNVTGLKTITLLAIGTAVFMVTPVLAIMALILSGGIKLAVIILFVYVLILLLSNVFFANYIAEIINIHMKKTEEKNTIWLSMAVIAAIHTLETLPYIGLPVSIISVTCGLALSIKALISKKDNKKVESKEVK